MTWPVLGWWTPLAIAALTLALGCHGAGPESSSSDASAACGAAVHSSESLNRFTLCSSDADCKTGRCYPLTAYVGVCDTTKVQPATDCTPDGVESFVRIECGCNNLSCGASQVCARVKENFGPTVAPLDNLCVDDACASPTDCGSGAVCTPPSAITGPGQRCMKVACRVDADCSQAPCGSCIARLYGPGQWGPPSISTGCVYPSPFLCHGAPAPTTTIYDSAAPAGRDEYSCD